MDCDKARRRLKKLKRELVKARRAKKRNKAMKLDDRLSDLLVSARSCFKISPVKRKKARK